MLNFKKALAALAVLAASALVQPAMAASIDFTSSGGTETGSGYSNVRTYTAGGVTVRVTAFSLLNGGNTFSNSNVGQYPTAGLGACNQTEGLGCGSPNHQVDNQGNSVTRDFVLFQFSSPVILTSAFVQTYSSADTDVAYYLGTNVANNLSLNGVLLSGLTALGFGSEQTDNSNSGSNTVAINAGPYNALLLGVPAGQFDDAFKIQTLTFTAVPEPLSITLFGTGLLGLGLVARRRRAA